MTVTMSVFSEPGYRALNEARLDHLASLGLPLAGRSVLEVGAGVGDLSRFFLDRGCPLVSTDARSENVAAMRARRPWGGVRRLDVEDPGAFDGRFDVVCAYGLLYHLADPATALLRMAGWCAGLLLVETCAAWDGSPPLAARREDRDDPRNSPSGLGCLPTRRWVLDTLRAAMPSVGVPRTQPDHPEFPLDWGAEAPPGLTRCVLVASRGPLSSATLADDLPLVYGLAEVGRG